MRSIAHFSIRICAEASQILGIEIPYWDFYSGADAELEVRRACLSVKRFGMEVKMNVRIRSLYLCVTDMDRAIDFYENFLERPVLKRDEVYSVFEADGFRLGLFAFQKAGEAHTFGSNCLPSIEVEDIETLRQKLSGLPVCFPLTRIGSNWVAEFVDSEGNHIELTAPVREADADSMTQAENEMPQTSETPTEERPDFWQEGAVYYEWGKIRIRAIREPDPQVICAEEVAQGWVNQKEDKYYKRIADHAAHKSISMVAEYEGNTAGYINVYPNAPWGPFGGSGWCEIVDFGVLEKYRRRGIGTALMDCAEKIAATFADTVYLAVGLHDGYGSAQRMYCKRGYLPDGSGVWHQNAPAEAYGQVCNDDDLNLYFTKRLR